MLVTARRLNELGVVDDELDAAAGRGQAGPFAVGGGAADDAASGMRRAAAGLP